MALGNRYFPAHPPGESCEFALDYSAIIPYGVGIASGTLEIVTNTNPVEAQSDWTQGTVQIIGRRVYCDCSGGVEGTDYQIRWTATDTQGNTWPRTCLVLCAQTN
jgi:hypothetical protein